MVIIRETAYKDSEAAFFEIEPGNPNEEVTVKDGNLTFVWNRGKSNENITDTRSGKEGFSFYYARYAFKDKFKVFDSSLASDPKNEGILGTVPNGSRVMIVINVKADALEKGVIRIVSAYFTSNPRLIDMYNHRKALKMRYKEYEEEDNQWLANHIRKIMEKRGITEY